MSEVRENIVLALKSRLESITTTNGYRNTMDTVETGYRDPSAVSARERPYAGIILMREDYEDLSGGFVEVRMKVGLAAYAVPASPTTDSTLAVLSSLTSDIRKALYSGAANHGVSGVNYAKLLSRQGTEGLFEAAKTKDSTMLLELLVKFTESITA